MIVSNVIRFVNDPKLLIQTHLLSFRIVRSYIDKKRRVSDVDI